MKDNSRKPPIDDEQLLAYLDGEADPKVAARIEESEEYIKRAKALARVQTHLNTQLYRLKCPETLQLGEYHLGLLSRKKARAIEQHLAECPHCLQEIAVYRDQLGEEVLDEKTNLFDQINVIAAQLVSSAAGATGFENTGQIPALGIRGGKEKTFVYEADGVQIVIDIQEDVENPGHKTLLGLITGITAKDFVVNLILDGDNVASSQVDDLGNFIIPKISLGKYQLNIHGPNVEIQILTFQVLSA